MLCKLLNTMKVGQGFPGGPVAKTPTFPHVLGNKLTQKDNAQWSAVYYTGGPKAESPLSQGP